MASVMAPHIKATSAKPETPQTPSGISATPKVEPQIAAQVLAAHAPPGPPIDAVSNAR